MRTVSALANTDLCIIRSTHIMTSPLEAQVQRQVSTAQPAVNLSAYGSNHSISPLPIVTYTPPMEHRGCLLVLDRRGSTGKTIIHTYLSYTFHEYSRVDHSAVVPHLQVNLRDTSLMNIDMRPDHFLLRKKTKHTIRRYQYFVSALWCVLWTIEVRLVTRGLGAPCAGGAIYLYGYTSFQPRGV